MIGKAVLLLLSILAGLSHQSAISFYGGYHQETIPVDERDSVSLEFIFRSLQDSGVLLIARFGTDTDYLAVLLKTGSQLEVVLSQGGEIFTLGSTVFTNESDFLNWQTFELELVNRTLSTKLEHVVFVAYTFMAPIEVTRLYFGGPESFFNQRYLSIPFPYYYVYVGCLANLTLNSRPVHVNVTGHGLDAGCCVAPRYPLWCVDTTRKHLTLTLPHLNSMADMVTVSFRLQLRSTSGGLVVQGHSLSSQWGLQLFQGQLQVAVNVSGEVAASHCPGELSELRRWYQVDVTLNSSHIECSVDGITETATIFFTSLTSSFFPRLLELGGRDFMGCFQRLRLNEVDVSTALLDNIEETASAVQRLPIPWNEFSYNATELVVGQGMQEKLTTDNIWIQLPPDEFADDLTSFYQFELENSIHFETRIRPRYGHLFIGHPAASVEGFDYANILSLDPAQQVGYSHGGQGNISDDMIEFRVWAACGKIVLAEYLTLLISVEEQEQSPRVRQSETLHLAVGTRRALTPEMVTVEDSAATDPTLIWFSVSFVSLQSSPCSLCPVGECDGCEGGIIIKNGVSIIKFFNQDEVNRGMISFQHFSRFSTSPMLITLGVTVQGIANASIDATIPVTLYQGHLNLTSNPSCLFVREGGMALLKPNHLNSSTDFEDQVPIISYDLLTLPLYGVLERYDAMLSEWVDLDNSSRPHTSPFGRTSFSTFTQADINNDRVRYIQSQPYTSSSTIETFQFHLRSYNFSGPTGQLCINIFPDAYLLQPSISVDLAELVVPEDGSAPINQTVVRTGLDDVQYLLMEPDLSLDIEQLDMVYTLVDPPSFGILTLHGEVLVPGDIFTYSDITSNALLYMHGDSENHLDHFSFYAEAGSTAYLPIRAPNRTANLTLVINITAVNDHAPTLVGNLENIRPPEGCWIPVTPHNINITDNDRPPDSLKIYLRKKGSIPNGIFAFRDAPDRAVTHFYMKDVLNDKVIFVHKLNASVPLNYTQVLRIDDGVHTIKKPITISAVPLSLNVSVSLPPNSECIGTIDADHASLKFHLNGSNFTATLCDHFGNNANLVPEIKVTVSGFPDHGGIFRYSHGNNTFTPVSHFAFHDLSKIVYILEESSRNATGDNFSLRFNHGHSVAMVLTLQVCILPALVPLSLQVSPLEVMQGGVAHVTTAHLMVASSREEEKGSLDFRITSGPSHGALRNQHAGDMSRSLLQFSHADMVNRSIIYECISNSSNSIPPTQDTVLLQVCSTFSCLEQQWLTININPVNLTVQNKTVLVREGGQYQFSLNDFEISAPPNYVIYIGILKSPDHGELYIQSPLFKATYFQLDEVKRGKLWYNNTFLENLQDNFEVQIDAIRGEELLSLDFIMRIKIEPVNNHPPEITSLNKKLTVVQRGSALITSSYLTAHDYDAGSNDDDLKWSIPIFLPLYGDLYLSSNPGSRIHNWTEGDIKNNRLYYRNTRGSNADVLILEVSDGEKTATVDLFVAIVSVDIRCPNLDPFQLMEGERKAITYQHFRYFAGNDNSLNDSDFSITINQSPHHGRLTLNGRELATGDVFTQDKINTSQLLYIHDHSNTITDNFNFTIFVPIRENGSKEDMFEIVIEPIDDDPPVAFINDPLFVVQKQRVRIDNHTILIEDIDSITDRQKDKVVCQLVQPATDGRLQKERFNHSYDQTENFTKFDLESSDLWYEHLSVKDYSPEHLSFNITDGVNKQTEIYNLTIIVLPPVISLELEPLTVRENKMAIITYEAIMVTHPYLSTVVGTITLIDGGGPRHGELRNTKTDSIVRSFTTDDIANKSIVYAHNGDESPQDSFQFEYEARDPSHFNRRSGIETFPIYITLVNDEPPIIDDNTTSLQLWTTETVVLEERYLNVTDYDTPASQLNLTFQIKNLGGYLAFANATSTLIHWFTQSDVRAHRVLFVHQNGPLGEIAYNVTDGVHTANGVITIFAVKLALECDINMWNSIQVDFLSSVNLTSQNLHCTFSDGGNDREVSYHISETRLGHFEVNSQVRATLTSTEITAGLVTYMHTETGHWMESERLLVSVTSKPAVPESDLPLWVVVGYPQPPASGSLAVNTGLNVSEGGTRFIDESMLDGRNLRYMVWMELQPEDTSPADLKVVYQIVSAPQHGNLILNGSHVTSFTQADLASATLHYTHDDSETLADEVLLNVSIRFANDTVLATYSLEHLVITVSPLNDQRPILLTTALEKMLVKAFDVYLSPVDLQIADGDSLPNQLHFSLQRLPDNVRFFLNGTLLTLENSTFTQEAIDKSWIRLHPFAVGVSNFSFTFTDDLLASRELEVFEFTLIVEKHSLELLNNQEIAYFQNKISGTQISSKHVNTGTNGNRLQTIFTVDSHPRYGRIMMGGTEIQNFTQVDIDHLEVMYVPHRGAQHHRDKFSLSITNANYHLTVNMSVRVMAWGQSETRSIDFNRGSNYLLQPLPSDVLVLTELEKAISYPPTIELLERPFFGHLEIQPFLAHVGVAKRVSLEIDRFRYDELQQGWIVYVWDYGAVANSTVMDSFAVLVKADGMQPGEAVINLTLSPPGGLATTHPATRTSTSITTHPGSSRSISAANSASGFPVYTLVPIIGIILVLILLIMIVVIFCLTQQKRIKKKWVPTFSHPRHQSPGPVPIPWAATSPPIPGQLTHYDIDPSAMPMGEMDHHDSETSSGFSEPDCSPNQTPVPCSPPHPLSMCHPRPPRSRMRSNVSITFSSRQSTASEMSLDDGGLHSSLSQYPPHSTSASVSAATAIPIPLPARSASHAAFNRPLPAVEDSGVASVKSHPSLSTTHSVNTENVGTAEQTQQCAKDDFTEWNAMSDFSDPNIQRLFHSHSPILNKEEYWV